MGVKSLFLFLLLSELLKCFKEIIIKNCYLNRVESLNEYVFWFVSCFVFVFDKDIFGWIKCNCYWFIYIYILIKGKFGFFLLY